MLTILVRKDNLICRHLPVNSKIRVIPRNRTFMLRSIEVIALILEYHLISQDHETMCKSPWNEKLAMIILGKFHSDMLAECWRSFSDIHSHIKNSTFYHSHELALRMRRFLEMETTKNTIAGLRLVILNEVSLSYLFFKILL